MGAPAVPSSLVASHLDPSSQETAKCWTPSTGEYGREAGEEKGSKGRTGGGGGGREEKVRKEKEEKEREVTDCSSGRIQRKALEMKVRVSSN